MGQQWPAAGSGALSEVVHALDLLKEVAIIFITSTIVWPQIKQQGGNTAPPINRKLDQRFTEHEIKRRLFLGRKVMTFLHANMIAY